MRNNCLAAAPLAQHFAPIRVPHVAAPPRRRRPVDGVWAALCWRRAARSE